MDNQLKLVVKSILEADEKASARRIIAQLPNIQKAVNAAGKLKLKLELDEGSVKQLGSLKSALDSIQNASRGNSPDNIGSRFTKGIREAESKITSLQKMLSFDHLSDGKTSGISSLRAELQKLEASYWNCLDTFNNGPKTPETYAHLTKDLDNLRTGFQSASAQAKVFDGTLASDMKLDKFSSDIRTAQNGLQALGTEWSSFKSNPQLLSEFDALTAKAKELDAVSLGAFQKEVQAFRSEVKAAGLDMPSFEDSGSFLKGINDAESKISSLQRMLSFDHLSDGTTSGIVGLRDSIQGIQKDYQDCLNTFNSGPKTPETYREFSAKLGKLGEEFKSIDQQARIFNGTFGSNMKLDRVSSDIQTVTNRLQTMGVKWSAMKTDPALLSEFDALTAKAKDLDAVNLRNFSKEVTEFSTKVKSAGLNTLSFGDAVKNAFTKFTEWFSVASIVKGTVQQIQNIIQSVIELDDSLTELQKVTDLTGSSLEGFVNKAFDMGDSIGRTGKEVIDAATVFKRAGYDLNESMSLAEASLVMTNVGDGIKDVTTASSALIAVLKGFKMSDTDAMRIVDAINETSNHAAIDFDNITEGLRRVSGTISQTGTSLAETIGLLTGGFGQLRNIENVSSGLTFISQRLRGIDEDGKAIDGLVPKLQKDFKEIAGIDIEDTNGELRSTYDILRDMARVFPTLSSQQQQYLGEMAAGNVAPHAAKAA